MVHPDRGAHKDEYRKKKGLNHKHRARKKVKSPAAQGPGFGEAMVSVKLWFEQVLGRVEEGQQISQLENCCHFSQGAGYWTGTFYGKERDTRLETKSK